MNHHEVFIAYTRSFIVYYCKFISWLQWFPKSFITFQDFSAAIECQFRFIETDVEYLKTNETNSTKVQLSNPQPFECDVPGNEVVTVRFNVLARDNNFYKPEEDDYESTEVCEVRKRTIYPKALNSVTNQLIPVVNNKEVIQAIEAEECV